MLHCSMLHPWLPLAAYHLTLQQQLEHIKTTALQQQRPLRKM
jgi:hypothetical protein